jgi:hypothetical protein
MVEVNDLQVQEEATSLGNYLDVNLEICIKGVRMQTLVNRREDAD